MFCRINHSCCPSAVWSWLESKEKTKEVRALRDLAAGEEVTTNYIDSYDTVTASKAERLVGLQHWDFVCGCEVCGDSEEEVQRNDSVRRSIGVQHQLVTRYMEAWRAEKAVEASRTKLRLMRSLGSQVLTSLPSALLELWEVARISQQLGVAGVAEDCGGLVREAEVRARGMGERALREHREKVAEVESTLADMARKRRAETANIFNNTVELESFNSCR